MQNNIAYEVKYEINYVSDSEYEEAIDEFGKVVDSIQILNVKRYEKGFYNNLTGIILDYPSLLPNSTDQLVPNNVTANKINFMKNYSSNSNAFSNLELSVFPYKKSLDDLDNDLKKNVTNNKNGYSNICETKISDNFGNIKEARKLNFNYTSQDNHDKKGLLFYAIYNNTYAHLFNFTAEADYYNRLLPTVEEIYDSVKIVLPIKYAEEDFKTSQHGLFTKIKYPEKWKFTANPIGFEIHWSDNYYEGLTINVAPAETSTLEDVVNSYINGFFVGTNIKNYTNFQLVGSEQSTLSNKGAHKIVYTYKDLEGCQCDIKTMGIFAIIDKKTYTLEYWTELDKFSSYLPSIEVIIDSIKIYENLANITPKSGLKLNGGPVDLAINPFTNRLYVAIPESRQVQVIDGDTDQIIQNITIGAFPNAVALNPYTNKIYVASPETDMIYVIDGVTNNITAKIQAGPLLGDIAVDTNEFLGFNTLVFVANQGNASISVIDDIKGKVVNNVKTSEGPLSIGIDSMTNRAYITTNEGIDIIDYTTNGERKVFATLYTKLHLDYIPLGIVVDSNMNTAYSTNYASNTVTVIDTVSNENISEINAGDFPNNLAFDPTENKLYVSNRGNNTVSVIDTEIGENVGNITVDSIPYDMVINPNTHIIYLAGFESKTLSTLNSSSGKTTVALTFQLNPSNAGRIECAGKEIPENSYQRLMVNTQCEPIANSGFTFSSWSPVGITNNSAGILNVSQYGTYTANFTSLPQFMQALTPTISITGLFAVILLAAIMPAFNLRKKIKDEKDELKGDASKLLSKAEIITIDATVIIGVLIFLSLTEGFELSEQYQINVITASIVFPFAISAIIGVTRREKFATRLMIAGFINLMISVILIAIMKL